MTIGKATRAASLAILVGMTVTAQAQFPSTGTSDPQNYAVANQNQSAFAPAAYQYPPFPANQAVPIGAREQTAPSQDPAFAPQPGPVTNPAANPGANQPTSSAPLDAPSASNWHYPQVPAYPPMHDSAYAISPDGTCGVATSAPSRMFVQLDMLIWGVSSPNVYAIGDAASEGNVTVNGNTVYRVNSLDTSFIDNNWSLGTRIDFGRIDYGRGWLASVLYYRHRDMLSVSGADFIPADPYGYLAGFQDSDNNSIDDDLDGDHVHGRFGRDLGTPDGATPPGFIAPFDGDPDEVAAIDSGDLVRWLVTFSQMRVRNTVQLSGFEMSNVWRSTHSGCNTLDWFAGVRYFNFLDEFDVLASGGVMDASHWNLRANNDILGPQVGVRWAWNKEWGRVTAEGRFLPGVNFQNNRLNGTLSTVPRASIFNVPVAFGPTSFNARTTETGFTPLGEWRLESSYYLNDWLALRFGYTGMVIGNVVRASDRVQYTLPAFRLRAIDGDTVFVNGLNVGFEINR